MAKAENEAQQYFYHLSEITFGQYMYNKERKKKMAGERSKEIQ